MRILSIEKTNRDAGRFRQIARFNLQYDEHTRFVGVQLVEAPDGQRLIYSAPGKQKERTATFSAAMARRIAELAAAAYDELGSAES